MNPYIILGLLVGWGASLAGAAYLGKEYADGQHAQRAMERKSVLDEVREANAEFADGVGVDVAAAVAGIRSTQTTINKEVRHEREIYHVLDDADCAVPPASVGVLNAARGRGGEADDREGAGGPAPGVPAAGEAGRR